LSGEEEEEEKPPKKRQRRIKKPIVTTIKKKVPTKGKQKANMDVNRKDAELWLNIMPVIVTGARPGEIILGTKTQSKDALIRIGGEGFVPPRKKDVDELRYFPDIWERFLSQLGSLEFFSNMSVEERAEWLECNESEKDIYIDEIEDITMEVLQLGKSDMLTLKAEDIDRLLVGPLLGSDIRAMFPRKPGSSGIRGNTFVR